MALGSNNVSHEGLIAEDFSYQFALNAATVVANIGLAMSLDAANNTAKVGADGDLIIGQLRTFEDRLAEGIKLGAIATKGGFKFTKPAAETINIGDSVVSAPAGQVKAFVAPGVYAAATVYPNNRVVAVNGNDIEVVFG